VRAQDPAANKPGRFVPGLHQDDFAVYEDNNQVEVTQFSAERVPVSLGIALDTSGSMAGRKMDAARGALARFADELLGQSDDQLFLYRFSDFPALVQGWTNDHERLLSGLNRMTPHGLTAMYDAVFQAIPMAQLGRNRKRALVVISDGNDTVSQVGIRDLKEQIRRSEVLVYAIAARRRGPEFRCRFPCRSPACRKGKADGRSRLRSRAAPHRAGCRMIGSTLLRSET
jgi:Ca-activated chloride channel family protein